MIKIDYAEKSHRYKVDGKAMPSVTTILSYVGKPGLIAWLKKHPEEFIKQEEEKAKSIGECVHEAIEKMLKGEIGNIETDYPIEVQAGIKAFFQWSNEVKLEPIHLETPLASLKYGYAGRVDFIGKINGVLCLADWKTSKKVYPEYHLQNAAYWQACRETLDIEPSELWIVRVDKETGIPEQVKATAKTSDLLDTFLAVKKIYDYIREAEK